MLTYSMKFLLLIGLTAIFVSCNNSDANEKVALLQGTWLFEDGTINESAEGAELLKNLMFEFSEDQFSCELLPEMHRSFGTTEKYKLDENKIVVAEKLELIINELSQEAMTVEFELKQQDFSNKYKLNFVKQ